MTVGHLRKQAFVHKTNAASLNVTEAQADPRLSKVDVSGADGDKNGRIEGAEWTVLFGKIDAIDTNGDPESVALFTRNGQPTDVVESMAAIEDLTGVTGLRQAAFATSPALNNNILHVGMNRGGLHEANQLRRIARGRVSGIQDTAVDDRVTLHGRTFDLTQRAEARAFARALGLPESQANRVGDIIHGASSDGRDELAQLAQAWAIGEAGGTIPSRLVLSGHSIGNSVWGDDNGSMRFSDIVALAQAMPAAAAQVEDLHLSACYCAGQANVTLFQSAFPNMQTAWLYEGSAPGAHSGATIHQRAWERATRGRVSNLGIGVAGTSRKSQNVAVWSRVGGYQQPSTQTLAEARAAFAASSGVFDPYFRGDRAVSNPQTGELRDHYNNVQALLQRSDLPASERPGLEQQRDQTIRLLYYGHVRERFASEYRARLEAGYAALGQTTPDFARMSRADAMASIRSLRRDINARGTGAPRAARQALDLLESGLRDLDPARVPQHWI